MKSIETKFDYAEMFDSVSDFRKGLERERTGKFATKYYSEMWDCDEWSGTKTFEQAETLMNEGYEVGAEKLMKKITMVQNNIKGMKPVYAVAGGTPVVARAIMGVPKAMYCNKIIPKPVRTRKVFIINTASQKAENEELLNSGAVMLNICNQLEMNDVRTEIIAVPKFSYYTEKNNDKYSHLCTVKIKGYRDTFNFRKIAYAIAHTSMFRRHGFKWLETCGAKESFKNRFCRVVGGYGYSYAREQTEAKNKLHQLGIIGKDDLVLTFGLVKQCNYDVNKVMQELKLK